MRQVHRVGEKLFIDYAGPTISIVNPDTGELRRAHIFVAVLGASNHTCACATACETQVEWLRGLSQALQFFGGVRVLVGSDNPRGLIKNPDRYEPQLNQATQACTEHYATAILSARPRRPQGKTKAEVGVQSVKRWILTRLRDQVFFTLAELNHAVAELLVELNVRPLKKLPGNRRECFESIDRPVLMPVPEQPYEIAQFKVCPGQHRLPRRDRRALLQRPARPAAARGRGPHYRHHR